MATEIQLPRPISRIVFRCSEQAKMELISKMQIHEGEILTGELLRRARETATEYNERLAVLIRQSIRQEEFLKFPPDIKETFLPPVEDAVNVIIFDPATPPQRIRVEGSVQKTMWIGNATPEAHHAEAEPVTGVVKLAIVVGKHGMVSDVDPLTGPEPLISSAVNAVRGWQYRPTLLNGHPVEVETTVDVAFPSDTD